MKCIQAYPRRGNDTTVIRIPDDEAAKLVATGAYRYVSKSEWKKQEVK